MACAPPSCVHLPHLLQETVVQTDITAQFGCRLDQPEEFAKAYYDCVYSTQSDDFGMPDRDSYTMNTMSKNNRPWREMVCRAQCIWTTTSYNRTHMHVREYG